MYPEGYRGFESHPLRQPRPGASRLGIRFARFPTGFHAPVAQLDRAPGCGPGGRMFESCRARQIPPPRRCVAAEFRVSDSPATVGAEGVPGRASRRAAPGAPARARRASSRGPVRGVEERVVDLDHHAARRVAGLRGHELGVPAAHQRRGGVAAISPARRASRNTMRTTIRRLRMVRCRRPWRVSALRTATESPGVTRSKRLFPIRPVRSRRWPR